MHSKRARSHVCFWKALILMFLCSVVYVVYYAYLMVHHGTGTHSGTFCHFWSHKNRIKIHFMNTFEALKRDQQRPKNDRISSVPSLKIGFNAHFNGDKIKWSLLVKILIFMALACGSCSSDTREPKFYDLHFIDLRKWLFKGHQSACFNLFMCDANFKVMVH